ncbi:MAG: hypothetical protein V4598_00380 [Bdellovibrionota bacterium]
MKFALALIAIAFTSSVFATDFHAKLLDVDCSISNGVVTRTSTFGKEFLGSVTETKNVKMDGLAPFIRKAIETATETPVEADAEYVYTMKHDGKSYNIGVRDSIESQMLVRMVSKICR